VTISREIAGSPGLGQPAAAGPGQVAAGPVEAEVGDHRVDPVLQQGAQPDQPGPVPQQRAQLPDRQRRNPRLREQVRAQQLRQGRGIDLVVLQPRRRDCLAPQRVHQVRVEAVVLQQLDQPAPAERGLERHRRPGRQIADQPQDGLDPVHRVLVQLHRPVLGDHRHLGALAVHVDADVNRLRLPAGPLTGMRMAGAYVARRRRYALAR
jgi:hypothetical protein